MHRLGSLLIIFLSLYFATCQLTKELCDCRDIEGKRATLFNSSDDLRSFAGIYTWSERYDKEINSTKQWAKRIEATCSGTLLNTRYILTTSNFRYPLWRLRSVNFFSCFLITKPLLLFLQSSYSFKCISSNRCVACGKSRHQQDPGRCRCSTKSPT